MPKPITYYVTIPVTVPHRCRDHDICGMLNQFIDEGMQLCREIADDEDMSDSMREDAKETLSLTFARAFVRDDDMQGEVVEEQVDTVMQGVGADTAVRPSLTSIGKLRKKYGTSAMVNMDNNYAYRVSSERAGIYQEYAQLINHTIPELVPIYDVWVSEGYLIVKMAKLFELNYSFAENDLENIFVLNDSVDLVEKCIPLVCDRMLRRVLAIQTAAAKALKRKYWDYGPHNVMRDAEGRWYAIDPF